MAVWCSEKTWFVFVTLFSIKFIQRASVADRWCPHYLGNIVQPVDCLYRFYIKPKTTQNRHFRPSHFWHKSARVCSTRDGPRRKSSASRTFCNHVSHAEWYKGSHQMPIYRNFNAKRAWARLIVQCQVRQNLCRTLYDTWYERKCHKVGCWVGWLLKGANW